MDTQPLRRRVHCAANLCEQAGLCNEACTHPQVPSLRSVHTKDCHCSVHSALVMCSSVDNGKGSTHQREADNAAKQAALILHYHSWQLTQLVSKHSSKKLYLLPDVVDSNVQNVLQSNTKSQLQCPTYSQQLTTILPCELTLHVNVLTTKHGCSEYIALEGEDLPHKYLAYCELERAVLFS